MGNIKDIYDATLTKVASVTGLTVNQAWPTWDRPEQSNPLAVLRFNNSATAGEGTSRRYTSWQAEYTLIVFATSEVSRLGYIDTLQAGLSSWGVNDGITLTSGAVTGFTLGAFERYVADETDPLQKVAYGVVVPLTFEFTR